MSRTTLAAPSSGPPARRAGQPPLRVTFVMEQHLGHRTFAANLRHVVEQAEGLQTKWVDVAYRPGATVWERLPGLGVRARGALRGRGEVRRACRADACDVRFFNTQVPAVLGGRRARAVPYVLCTDVTPVQYDAMASGYDHRPDADGVVARLKHRINTSVFAGASCTVAWSRWVRDSLVGDYGVEPARIEVIPPGVDVARWAPAGGPRRGPVRLLFVGGDLHRKGGQVLLRAFRGLPAGSAELTLVTRTVHAGGPGVRVLNGLQPNSAELRAAYASSDVFVLPSAAETFGIAAVEAAASALPIVASDVGGLRDVVDDGRTGFLVQPGDATQLRRRLADLIDDAGLRHRLGAAGRRRAEERFDARTNAARLERVLRAAAQPASTRVGEHA